MKHDDFEARSLKRDEVLDHRQGEREYKTGRVPMCLGTTAGCLISMGFQEALDGLDKGRKHVLSVSTAEATRMWDLVEI